MVPPGAGNEARWDGRRGVGVSQSTAEAGELSPRDPVEGRVPINAFSSVERGPSGSVGRP